MHIINGSGHEKIAAMQQLHAFRFDQGANHADNIQVHILSAGFECQTQT
jgi:hypothetical protein